MIGERENKKVHPLEKRTTTHDDWARLKTPLDPQISPDASRIAYVLKTTNVDKNRYESHIWVMDTDGGPGRLWTNGSGENGGEGSPRWSPGGEWLAFTSGRDDKKGQIYRISTHGGEAEKMTDLPAGSMGELAWSPDGLRIAFTFRPQDEEWRDEAIEERKKAKKSSPPRVFTRRHWREEGTGFVPRAYYHVHVLDVETREVKPLTSGDRDFGPFCWSPDSTQIVIVSNVDAHPDLRPNADALFVFPAGGLADGAEPTRLNAPLGPKGNLAWSPDGKTIAYLGHANADEVWGVTNVHPWMVPADGAAPARDLAPDSDVQYGNASLGDVVGSGESGPVWASDSQSILVLASENGSVDLYRVSHAQSAAHEKLTEGRHVIAGFTADATAQTFALLRATPTDGGDLYALSITGAAEKAEPRRLTDLNAELLAGLNLPEPIAFNAPSPEGHTIPCWAILPPDFDSDPTPRPTILYIHGGPHLMYAHTMFHEYQALAARGYVVVYPNPRGSKGYGEAWTAGIKGDWGTPAQADCEACLDYAIKQGWTDGDKLGIAGGSYGGYLTGWMVGHSNRFKAAVAERSVFNLQSMAGTCDFVWRDHDYFQANQTSDPADYLRNSPLTYADDITTPLLIIHSEGDLRCPIEQAEQLFAALVLRNRDVTFLRYGPESNHNLSRGGPPDLRADRQERIAEFFARYLKGN